MMVVGATVYWTDSAGVDDPAPPRDVPRQPSLFASLAPITAAMACSINISAALGTTAPTGAASPAAPTPAGEIRGAPRYQIAICFPERPGSDCALLRQYDKLAHRPAAGQQQPLLDRGRHQHRQQQQRRRQAPRLLMRRPAPTPSPPARPDRRQALCCRRPALLCPAQHRYLHPAAQRHRHPARLSPRRHGGDAGYPKPGQPGAAGGRQGNLRARLCHADQRAEHAQRRSAAGGTRGGRRCPVRRCVRPMACALSPPAPGFDRARLGDGWYFVLPASWLTAGAITLRAEVDPRQIHSDPNRATTRWHRRSPCKTSRRSAVDGAGAHAHAAALDARPQLLGHGQPPTAAGPCPTRGLSRHGAGRRAGGLLVGAGALSCYGPTSWRMAGASPTASRIATR